MLKRIYKVVGHDMYDILVCGPYGNFQDKFYLDMGVCVCFFVCVGVYFSSHENEFVFMWVYLCVF